MDTMKQTPAVLAEMLASKDCIQMRDRRDCDIRSHERTDGELDRVRTRERLEATLAGLGELEYLRQRQDLLVRNVLNAKESLTLSGEDKVCLSVEENYLNSEEKLLEENILLLRKQLNCLRKRDAGLINQLQELDRQISDLRLDSETTQEHVESDSRPSSGFYELSDGASGSLSNSSNSVFSECLSSCHSSTCFCSPLDTSLWASEGQPKSADEVGSCVECDGQCEKPNSGAAGRSLSAPYSPTDSCSDGQTKYHCDLMARNGSDVYRYPSPLHAVAVRSPIFFQSLVGPLKEDGGLSKSADASGDGQKGVVSQSTSWPAVHTPTNKKVENYILGLLQRRAQPVRTNKPRTSINTDPSKSILRQASLCVRQAGGGPSQGRIPDLKTNWQGGSPTGAAGGADPKMASPQKQWIEAKEEFFESGIAASLGQPQNGCVKSSDSLTRSLVKTKSSSANKGTPGTAVKDYHELSSPKANSSPKEDKRPYIPMLEDSKAMQAGKMGTPKNGPKPFPSPQNLKEEFLSLAASSQSQDQAGRMVSAQYIPAQRQAGMLRKGGKSVKVVKVKSTPLKGRAPTEPGAVQEKHRGCSKKPRVPDEAPSMHRASRKLSSRAKRIPASIPEGRVMDRHASIARSGVPRHHWPGREAVLIKPKSKRNDYHRLRSIAEVPYEEAVRRAHRRQRRGAAGQVSAAYLPSGAQVSSPYAYAGGSDSEYSAECASLFHSTILDTSGDERSNYTTNRFGDSESSVSEADLLGESTTTSDSEEAGPVNWPPFGQATGPAHPQAKAFVKIKASHNLKKKILRFRSSGSLKVMTTV